MLRLNRFLSCTAVLPIGIPYNFGLVDLHILGLMNADLSHGNFSDANAENANLAEVRLATRSSRHSEIHRNCTRGSYRTRAKADLERLLEISKFYRYEYLSPPNNAAKRVTKTRSPIPELTSRPLKK
jgi:hypothetical protein